MTATSATIEQTIIGVAMDIEIGGSKISYDSTKEQTANNPLGEFFKALIGSKFTIDARPQEHARSTKIEGRDDFLKKLVAANPQMKPLLETILSEDALKEMAEPTFAAVPTKDVAKGDKWKRDQQARHGADRQVREHLQLHLRGRRTRTDKSTRSRWTPT